MPTESSAESFDFGTVKGRPVEAAFDGGLVTSDAGALLLGATDRAIDLVDRVLSLGRHWPKTRIVWRGDSHYGRVEAMDWADDNRQCRTRRLGGGGRRQSALLSCDE